MEREQLSVYEEWDLTAPAMPARSRLYQLAPLGVGTPFTESLTSYFSRLAAAHCVRPVMLLAEEVGPLLSWKSLLRPVNHSRSSFLSRQSPTLNGTGDLAKSWVEALATLTLRSDLSFLTLLPWHAVVPTLGLLRRWQAWCPACYADWRAGGQPVYAPLLWCLEVVTVCPQHQCRLTLRCPHAGCQRSHAPLHAHSRPGHCPWCGGWLGSSATAALTATVERSAALLAWQRWGAQAVGELLATAPTRSEPPMAAAVHAAVIGCVQCAGGIAALARELGAEAGAVAHWYHGRSLPRLAVLLQLCYQFGLTPLQVVTGAVVRPNPAQRRPRPPADGCGPARPFPPQRFDHVGRRAALDEVLHADEQPPPSMAAVAHRLHCRYAALLQYCPAQCRAISARYLAYRRLAAERRRQRIREEVQAAVAHLHAQGRYPSASGVARLLTHSGEFHHLVAQTTWQEALRHFGWKP